MEIKQLEYVIMAADMGSFNKASEFLYTTQSNVSKVIGRLEKELGYEIFRRQGNGVALTEAGEMLYGQSKRIMEVLQKIQNFSEVRHKTCFHIASVVSNFIAGRFACFVSGHNGGEYCLKMWEGNISTVLNLVERGEAEMGFMYLGEKQYSSFQTYLQRKGLYFKEIMPAQVELCLGRKNPMTHRDFVLADELRELKYVCLLEDNISQTYHLRQLEQSLHLEDNMEDAIKVGSNCALMNIIAVTDRAYLCYGTIMDTLNTEPDKDGIRTIPVRFARGEEKVGLGYIHKISEPVSFCGQEFLKEMAARYDSCD